MIRGCSPNVLAYRQISVRFVHQVPNIIGGKHIYGDPSFPVYSPNEPPALLHTTSQLTNFGKSIPELLDNAAKGFTEWSSKSYIEKSDIFQLVISKLEESKDEMIKSQIDIGMAPWFAGFNVDGAIAQVKECISQLSAPDGIIPKSMASDLSMVIRQPIGPVLSIAPWNAPVILAARSICAPLAAGCSVVLKASERSPLPFYLLTKCFLEAGIPANTLQLINVKPEDNPEFIGEALSSEVIRKVNFTGSTNVGRKIAALAAQYHVPYLLELGSKNYSIVDKDCDMAKATDNIIWSAWSHKGQICMSTDKVYIHESIYNEFKTGLLERAQAIAQDPDYQICQRAQEMSAKIIDLVDDSLANGAKVIFGNYNPQSISETNIIDPMILEGVGEKTKLDKTELFGPLFSICSFTSTQELISRLNQRNESGLKVSIWSTDIMNAIDMAKSVQAGGVHINGSTVHDEATIPHGGIKHSGSGRFNSSWGINEFSNIKTITVNK